MNRWRPLFLLVWTLAGLTCTPRGYAACGCLENPSATEALQSFDAVFTGWVFARIPILGSDRSHFLLFVDRAWKGSPWPFHSVDGGGECGFDFHPGLHYLVFAHQNEDHSLDTNFCAPTAAYFEGIDSMDAMGRPHPRVWLWLLGFLLFYRIESALRQKEQRRKSRSMPPIPTNG